MKIIRILTILCAFALVAPMCAKQALRSADPQKALADYLLVQKQKHERACAYLASQQQEAGGIVLHGAQSQRQPVCPVVAQRKKAQAPVVNQPVASSSSSAAPVLVSQQPQQVSVTPQQPVQPQQVDGVQQQVQPGAVGVQQAQGVNTRWIGENSYWAQNVSAPVNSALSIFDKLNQGCQGFNMLLSRASADKAAWMAGFVPSIIRANLKPIQMATMGLSLVDDQLSGRPFKGTVCRLSPTAFGLAAGYLNPNGGFLYEIGALGAQIALSHALNLYLQPQAQAAEQPDVDEDITELVNAHA